MNKSRFRTIIVVLAVALVASACQSTGVFSFGSAVGFTRCGQGWIDAENGVGGDTSVGASTWVVSGTDCANGPREVAVITVGTQMERQVLGAWPICEPVQQDVTAGTSISVGYQRTLAQCNAVCYRGTSFHEAWLSGNHAIVWKTTPTECRAI